MSYGWLHRINGREASRLNQGDVVFVRKNEYFDKPLAVEFAPRRDVIPRRIRLSDFKEYRLSEFRVGSNVKKALEERMQTTYHFSAFERYFRKDGFVGNEQEAVRDFLDRLCQRTGHFWSPGLCRAVPHHTEEANDELRRSKAKGVLGPVVPKRFFHDHFFWASKANGSALIIDPTGWPGTDKIDGKYEEFDILPYFGLIGNADGYQARAYRHMKDLDRWGTLDPASSAHSARNLKPGSQICSGP